MKTKSTLSAALAIGSSLASLSLGQLAQAQGETNLAAQSRHDFIFSGGSPHGFVSAVDSYYKPYAPLNWAGAVDIPQEMQFVHVPAIRFTEADHTYYINSLEFKRRADEAPGLRPRHTRLEAIIALYNRIGRERPEVGKLVVEGDLANPSVVMFVVDKAAAAARPPIKMKAISIKGISAVEAALRKEMESATFEAQFSAERGGSVNTGLLDGRISIHSDTGLLLVSGPESYIETVESIVNVLQANYAADKAALEKK